MNREISEYFEQQPTSSWAPAGRLLATATDQDTDLGAAEYEPPGGGGDALHLLLRQVAGVETQVGHLLAPLLDLSLIITLSLTNRKQLWTGYE